MGSGLLLEEWMCIRFIRDFDSRVYGQPSCSFNCWSRAGSPYHAHNIWIPNDGLTDPAFIWAKLLDHL